MFVAQATYWVQVGLEPVSSSGPRIIADDYLAGMYRIDSVSNGPNRSTHPHSFYRSLIKPTAPVIAPQLMTPPKVCLSLV